MGFKILGLNTPVETTFQSFSWGDWELTTTADCLPTPQLSNTVLDFRLICLMPHSDLLEHLYASKPLKLHFYLSAMVVWFSHSSQMQSQFSKFFPLESTDKKPCPICQHLAVWNKWIVKKWELQIPALFPKNLSYWINIGSILKSLLITIQYYGIISPVHTVSDMIVSDVLLIGWVNVGKQFGFVILQMRHKDQH